MIFKDTQMLSSRLPVFILVMMSLWCQATADKYYKSGWKAVSTSDKIGKKRPSYSMARSTSANDVGKNEGNDMTQRLVNTSEIIANITGQVGSTVFLPCTTHHALERQVSWVRRRDWHILTSGGLTYTQEGRFNVHHPEGTTEWTLAIKYVRLRDTGIYECQIAAGEGLMSQSVFLNVVVPQAVIPGQGEYHVDTGSTITLDCYIQQSSEAPPYIFWYHNARMINYDRKRGGVKVHIDTGPRVRSRLTLTHATPADSGNYTCAAANTEPASTAVFVTEDNKIAAIQPWTVESGTVSLGATSIVNPLLTSILLPMVIRNYH